MDQLELDFQSGMTVLTGETGAGKSILLDALAFVLGERADQSLIRPNTERCDISACFNIEKIPTAQQWLIAADLASDTSECILRRTLSTDKRSKNFINDHAVSLQSLRELGALLLTIHGQHAHHALLKSETQRAILDTFGQHDALCTQVEQCYKIWHQTQSQLTDLRKILKDRNSRSEFLNFQLQELRTLNPQKNELESLEKEHKKLANTENIQHQCQHVLTLLNPEDHSNKMYVAHLIQETIHTLAQITKQDDYFNNAMQSLNNALINCDEAARDIQHYLENIDNHPERLIQLEQRLTAHHDLARKHRIAPDQLYDFHQNLETEFQQLENSDQQLHSLENLLAQHRKDYLAAAAELSTARTNAAVKLSKTLTTTITQLAMPHAQFKIEMYQNDSANFSPNGLENIEFHITTNPGQPLQPLHRIVSGGELSRIYLAIQSIAQQKNRLPTLIFDEIDTGIGGNTAAVVGKLLQTLGQNHQVLCITHLPQVAAMAHQHFYIKKQSQKNTTITTVDVLDATAKIYEIARMIGGTQITEQGIAYAKELING